MTKSILLVLHLPPRAFSVQRVLSWSCRQLWPRAYSVLGQGICVAFQIIRPGPILVQPQALWLYTISSRQAGNQAKTSQEFSQSIVGSEGLMDLTACWLVSARIRAWIVYGGCLIRRKLYTGETFTYFVPSILASCHMNCSLAPGSLFFGGRGLLTTKRG